MDGVAPGSLFVDPDTHPPDESLGALGGSLERAVDEVSGSADDVGRLGCNHCRSGSAQPFFLLQFVAQTFAFAEELFEKQ